MKVGFLKNRWLLSGAIVVGIWVLIAVLINSILMPAYTRQGSVIRVPDATGQTLSEVRMAYPEERYRFEVSEERAVSDVPRGVILEQWPTPGNTCKPGRRIHVVVSSGPPVVTVPDVVGMTSEDALFKIQAAGLVAGGKHYRFSRNVYEGVVLAQSPFAGALVGNKDTVTAYISLGPEPSEIVVPNVTGMDEDHARYLIRKSGLRLGEVTYDRYVNRPGGTVIIQEPAAGTPAMLNDRMKLVVNR